MERIRLNTILMRDRRNKYKTVNARLTFDLLKQIIESDLFVSALVLEIHIFRPKGFFFYNNVSNYDVGSFDSENQSEA